MFDEPIILLTVGMVADELKISRNAFKYWADKANEKWFYVPPYALTAQMRHAERSFIKLWHPDQLPEISKAWVKYNELRIKQSVESATRRKEYLKEYNKRYYEEKLKSSSPKPSARYKKPLEYAPPSDEAKSYEEEFHQDREDMAMKFLIEKGLV